MSFTSTSRLLSRLASNSSALSSRLGSRCAQMSTAAWAPAALFSASGVVSSTSATARRTMPFTIPAASLFGFGAAKKPAQKEMFCFQCEQTENNTGCTTVGVCGKTPDVAALQDLLVNCCKGISVYAAKLVEVGGVEARVPAVDHFVLEAMFSTLTNVNFDGEAIANFVRRAEVMRNTVKKAYENKCRERGVAVESLGPVADFKLVDANNTESLRQQGTTVGILARREVLGADRSGLQEMCVYGLKGTCAYAEHALRLGQESPQVFAAIHQSMAMAAKVDPTVDELLTTALKIGETNLQVAGLLDQGHTGRFGHPVPTQVSCKPKPGKAILVSGHDMHDLHALLEQTAGKGVNVYTHGEMLPAHGYPGLKKYPHLAGHFGGPWQLQKFEFGQFPGAILMTTNCLVEPQKKYKDRIFTASVTGWPGISHINGQDFRPLIDKALACDGFEEDDLSSVQETFLTTGFGHNAVMGVADKVIAGVKSGAIKQFFVVGGCDGAEGERSYFTEFAKATPKDSIILTLGCGKYRFNRLQLGDIGGIPRVLDMGQCNDFFSAVQVAVALAGAFKTDVNGLPLGFAVSWFEQKAVAVLLTLLHLGIRNIRLGPRLPGFATPNMLAILQQKFNLGLTGDHQQDMAKMLNKQ